MGFCSSLRGYFERDKRTWPLTCLYLVYLCIFSNPWFTDQQHSGFEQIFSGVIFISVKGASHTVPQTKRA